MKLNRVPSHRAGQSPSPDVEAAFRTAMRSVAAHVTLITSRDDQGNFHGMAATSVISVSMQPPSMLISVNNGASISKVLSRGSPFCINILRSEHLEIVEPFSNSALRDRRFQSAEWAVAADGVPYLASASAAIFCDVDASLPYGTHTLHVGRILDVRALGGSDPLLWFEGARARLMPA